MSAASTSVIAGKAFDQIADRYDDTFTRSCIGRAQRQQVWRRLIRAFGPGSHLLELNCGTGEDALFLARHGRSVLACDASTEMIRVAQARCEEEGRTARAEFRVLANEDLAILRGDTRHATQFDGAFSNFSGMNCLADLRPAAENLAALLKPGAPLLLCLSTRFCPGEWVWYLAHGEKKKAFRRVSGRADAKLGDVALSVTYPTIRQLRHSFSPWFRLKSRRAVGLFVPPSYAEGWASLHRGSLALFERMDRAFAAWPALRDIGDHVLLEFVKCRD